MDYPVNLTYRSLFYYMCGLIFLASCSPANEAAMEFPFQTILTDTISFNTDTLTLTENSFVIRHPITSADNILLDENELKLLELTDITYLFEPTDLIIGSAAVKAELRYALPDSTLARSRIIGTIDDLFSNPLTIKKLPVSDTFDPNRLEEIFTDRKRFRMFFTGNVNAPPAEGNLILQFHWRGQQIRL